MQYSIALPADYDMGIIRKRVAAAAPVLDDRAGLGFKAYLLRERGIAGAPVNEYAPFYVWRDSAGAAQFLLRGGGFQNIIRSFGRPSVQQWLGVSVLAGAARGERVAAATRRIQLVQDDVEPAELMEREIAELQELAACPDVHTAALAVDPNSWQSVRFALWREGAEPRSEEGDRFEVLHFSAPELVALHP